MTALLAVLKGISDGLLLASNVAKGFSLGEIGQIIGFGQDLQAFLAVDGQVVPEWESLNDADRAQLVAYIASNVKLPLSQTAEVWAQKVLDVAVALSAAYQAAVLPTA